MPRLPALEANCQLREGIDVPMIAGMGNMSLALASEGRGRGQGGIDAQAAQDKLPAETGIRYTCGGRGEQVLGHQQAGVPRCQSEVKGSLGD